MSEQLKPCPRCGGECTSVGTLFQPENTVHFWVECCKCALICRHSFDTEQEAIDWWNDRKADEVRIETRVVHDLADVPVEWEVDEQSFKEWVEAQKAIQRSKGK